MLYKTVAYNYAQNLSGFWQMKFTNTSMPVFCEQPPLYFYLLGWFYKMMGTHYLSDRFFTLLLLLTFLFISNNIANKMLSGNIFLKWLFLFFILSIPVFCWSYVNQVIEPLVNVFICIGIWCFLQFRVNNSVFYLLAFGLNLIALFLTKGFQSCFIIVLPIIYFLFNKNYGFLLNYLLYSVLVFALSLIVLLALYPASQEWFRCYYDTRLVLTMQNVGKTTDYHAEIIIRFFTELIVPLGVVGVLLVYLGVKKNYPVKFAFKNFYANKLAMALLLCALIGSFSYAISLVQRGFYLVPAFVCFLFSFLLGLKRYWLFLGFHLSKITRFNLVKYCSIALFLSSLIYFVVNYNKYKRDENLLSDLEKIKPYIGGQKVIKIEPELWNYFSLHAYLYISDRISLSTEAENTRYYITDKNHPLDKNKIRATKLNLDTKELEVYFFDN